MSVLAVVSVVLGGMVAVSGVVAAGPAGMAGSGTAEDPYVITNVEQLQAMEQDLDAHYVLGNDINATGYAYTSVGSGIDPFPATIDGSPFSGTLDGQGHVITGLSIHEDDDNFVGLFGAVNSSGVVTNVGLEDVDVRGQSGVGGLVGQNLEGTVSESYATGDVSGSTIVGGLVGQNLGTVTESYATGDVSGGGVGGLVGENSGTVSESYATGDVSGGNNVGGLVGQNLEGTVTESYATGAVSGSFVVGGLVGLNSGTVSESYATGDVNGVFDVGGLVGANFDGTVSDSYWDTQTTGQSVSDGGTGLTTPQMTGEAATTNMDGFDFTTTWTTTDAYPILQWQPPPIQVIAEITPDNLDEGENATITATVSNQENTVRSVTLTLAVDDVDVATEELDVGIDATSEATLDHTFTDPGEHTVSLTVTDGATTETFEWTVDVNALPIAAFDHSPPIPTTNETVTFDASDSTDPNGEITSYEWDFDDDGDYDDATGVMPTKSYATVGEKTVSVRVTDDDGASDTATHTFRVNAPPTVGAGGDATIGEGVTLSRTVSITDPGSSNWTVAVDYGDGATDRLDVTDANVTLDHTYVDDGSYTVSVEICDEFDACGVDGFTVTVENVAPTLTTDVDDSAAEGDLVSASGSFTDPGTADTHTVAIDWGDDTVDSVDVTQDAGSGSFAVDHVYADDGAYTVTITVADDDDGSDTSTENVTISNVAPSVSMALDESIEDEHVSLSATLTDPGTADTHTASVDWGDGTSESVAVDQGAGSGSLSTTHVYATGGIYSVELTVIDDDGGAATVIDSITVSHVVEMDVKPGNGDETDPINTRARGVIPVAIYTTGEFDASTVDVASLRFGAPDTLDDGDGATIAHDGHLEDVDDDGDLDLVVHFTADTGLTPGDTDAEVVGETADGVPFSGDESVRIVGGNGGGNGKGNGGGNGNGRGNGR